MPYLKTKNAHPVEIYYEDLGKGKPVVLIHGWPLSARSWEAQIPALLEAGFRVVAYDRRGFGRSSASAEGYDYDTMTADLHALITELQLKDATLVGFSMGGGEVVRYFTNHGGEGVSKAVLMSSIIPIVKQTDDNPDGVPQDKLDEVANALKEDRISFVRDHPKNFYNVGLMKSRPTEAEEDFHFMQAAMASPVATAKAAASWAGDDFRPEMKNVNVPTLIIHGEADKIVPIKTGGEQAAKGIANSEYHAIEDAPHGLNLTHADEVNAILINFLNK